MIPRPSIGRIVHYVAPGSADGTYPPAHRAAIVTEADETGHVSLAVMNPNGMHFVDSIRYSPDGEPFTWHWPEIVEERVTHATNH